jgi:hypothetical protein
VGIYAYAWYCGGSHESYDLGTFVQATRTGLTATSILLPGAFIAAQISTTHEILLDQIYFGSVWFGLSILCAIINLFRLPTIIGRKTTDNGRPTLLDDNLTIIIGLIQLMTIVLGSARVIIAFA